MWFTSVEYEVIITSLELLAMLFKILPVCERLSLPQGHDAGSHSTCQPPGLLVLLCKTFSNQLDPACLRSNYVLENLSLRLIIKRLIIKRFVLTLLQNSFTEKHSQH